MGAEFGIIGMTPEEEKEYRRRQKGRNWALGAVLIMMVILFYMITIVRIGAQ